MIPYWSVSSELGILQPITEIAELLKSYPKCFFHVDMTQSIGKVTIPLKDIDLVSFSAHKFYGMKGIGVLVKKESVVLQPLIHGGKSTTIWRSGTPALALIVSLSKALRLAFKNMESNQIEELNQYLREQLSQMDMVHINSPQTSIPHILNFSVPRLKPETLQHALEEKDIFISTQTACSKGGSPSTAVMALTHDESYATSSVRVSISHLTTKDEICYFVKALIEVIERLQIRG